MLVAWSPTDVLQSIGGAALHGMAWDPAISTFVYSTVYISQIHVPVCSRSSSSGMMDASIRRDAFPSLKISTVYILKSILRLGSFCRYTPASPTLQRRTTKLLLNKRTHVANFSSSLVSSSGFPACRTLGQLNQ